MRTMWTSTYVNAGLFARVQHVGRQACRPDNLRAKEVAWQQRGKGPVSIGEAHKPLKDHKQPILVASEDNAARRRTE